jgi:uncharacterized protein (DUF2147 family)
MRTGKWIVSLAILILSFAVAAVFRELPVAAADGLRSGAGIDEQRLAGRWVRPDGGYILELKEIGKDGSVKAAYFNPRPINVAKAVLGRKEGRLTIFVELRDVNYPGSTYHLQYDAKSDRLKGVYFQAVQGATYYVEFIRAK